MKVGVGYVNSPDSEKAGSQAAVAALQKAGRDDPCDLALLFCTARHDQEALRKAVAEVVGDSCLIYGGGAVGVITNDDFGYAGDQVGIACIWFEENECRIFSESGLAKSEHDTGERLGRQLAEAGTRPDSPVMLFYDAVEQTQEQVRLLMATWLLEGIEKGLGFLPDLTGAGIQGDHICTPTRQYMGDKIDSHGVFALTFSDGIQVDHVIMHGCKPASPYYTVTKAEGPVILEINGVPAVNFMDGLLGPSLGPEDYPFSLLFGINNGERWNDFSEESYASRLCLGLDKERGGIVMFEPDMVEGTQFQVMARSLDMSYMEPKIQGLFDKLGDREPVFAIYIDCAGRCAGYGGIELEDAYVIQRAVGDRMPLLGLYTGVEIGSSGGRPHGLDWTGVLCVFSKGEKKDKSKRHAVRQTPAFKGKAELGTEDLKKLAEQNVAKILELDVSSIAIRHELEQKRQGFSLLAELAVSLRQGIGNENIFYTTAQRINSTLNMQKTVVLSPSADGTFAISVLQGYSAKEKAELIGLRLTIGKKFLDAEKPVLVTAADDEGYLSEMRSTLKLPYFISTPVVIENEVVYILITGRMMEAPPFLSRLTYNDAETVQAISALLGSVLMHQRLDNANKLAQTDALTEVLNRRAFEWQATELLRREISYDRLSALMMIDIDHFKAVNDEYGHATGDMVIKALAGALHKNFRSTDIISRLGGDEFAVCCPLGADEQPLLKKVTQFVESWNSTPIAIDSELTIHSSLSIGIAIAPRDGTSYAELLKKADIALYRSKENGRNQFTVYDEETIAGVNLN